MYAMCLSIEQGATKIFFAEFCFCFSTIKLSNGAVFLNRAMRAGDVRTLVAIGGFLDGESVIVFVAVRERTRLFVVHSSMIRVARPISCELSTPSQRMSSILGR